MFKKLLPLLFFSVGLNASLCDSFSDLRVSEKKEQPNSYVWQNKDDSHFQEQTLSPERLEKKIDRFINNGDSYSLDRLLKRTDGEIKKNILNKKLQVLNTQGKPFTTTFLRSAVDFNEYEIVKVLLCHGANINLSGSDGYSPLTIAVYRNLPYMVELLVQLGAGVNGYDENGSTALYIATRKSYNDLVSLLAKLGADMNLARKDGWMPITQAVADNNEKMLIELVKNGANINLCHSTGYSPLTSAVYRNLPDMIERLVQLGADVNSCDENGSTALYIATWKSHINLVPLLVRFGADINLARKDGWTPIAKAVEDNNEKMLIELVKNGANINLSGSDGYSPLTSAVYRNFPDMVELLVQLGVDVNSCDENGSTALYIATRKSYNDLVSLLIKLGANVNSANKYGTTPLHKALKENNESLAEELVRQGADVNAKTHNGNTALHIAIEKSYDKLIELLVNNGASVTLQNKKYISPILMAASYDKKEALKLFLKKHDPDNDDFMRALRMNDVTAFKMLLECCKTNPFLNEDDAVFISLYALALGNQEVVDICRSADKDFIHNYVYTHPPLHYAAMHGHEHLVCYFVEKCKANINDVDYYGLTALHYAAIYGHEKIAKYLVNKKAELNKKSLKDFEHYKKGSTPLDLATQFGNDHIAKFLSKHGAKNNITKSMCVKANQAEHLAVFVDFENELVKSGENLVSVKLAFSGSLCNVIRQNTCPIIIVGQHLLKNALQLSCSLEDWIVIQIRQGDLDGYLIVPKQLVYESMPPGRSFIGRKTNFNSQLLDAKLQAIGFNLSSVQHCYVDESFVLNKQSDQKSLKENVFSSQVPALIDGLLIARERFIYWGGHGLSGDESTICNLFCNDAIKFLNILAKKGAQVVYVSSCFFGGKKFKEISDFDEMILISGTTDEISSHSTIAIRPDNWPAFFRGLSLCKGFNNYDDVCGHLAKEVVPLIITHKPNITNFPHVKFPGMSPILLEVNNHAMLFNKKVISNYQPGSTIPISGKQLLEIDVAHVKNMLEIRNKIPLLISNFYKTTFEKIYIDVASQSYSQNFHDVLDQFLMPKLFDDSTLENIFVINEMYFSVYHHLDLDDGTKINVARRLYNVVMSRGPGNECYLFFGTRKNIEQDNVVFVLYDATTKKWEAHKKISTDEFDLYKQLLKLDI